ncbi:MULTISPECIES: recombinase family protein [unclassified Chelatococcus]|uniref:recombinase family protein n=1 Tax=unclassified Chelatococcus TaxID=2638111 RepID=UPI0020BDFCF7|nr:MULTISPECIES: recombinase family protein [unclassified Chelatococcus]
MTTVAGTRKMRAAIYSRFSTDLQSDRSIEDQVALCRRFAERNGYVVTATFDDRARSGASVFGRDGLARMMEMARARGMDVIVVEALDRLSRDMADLAGIHKQLEFLGIEIVAVNGGRVDTAAIGIHGLVGQMQREEGARKVRRGMQGVVRDGRHAGGRAFGYRPVSGKPGELEIVPEEAAIIQRIFREYRSGVSPRTIAAKLNSEGVPPPRGQRWNGSTINGNRQRGHGILQNPLYVGRNIWNRVRMVKDPSTGRRVSRVNPESEWLTSDAPHLRIVDQETFDAVRGRKESRGGAHAAHAPRSKRLLSGLLRCGGCGGGMTIIGRDRSGPRIQCSTRRESKACDNGARYYVEKIERLVVDALRIQLASPTLIREYVEAYREERRQAEAGARRDRARIEKGLADANAAIKRLVDALAKGVISEEDVAERMVELRADKEKFTAELALAGQTTNVIELRPQAVERFRENMEALAAIVSKDGEISLDLAEPFHALVESVVVNPRRAGEEYEVSINGHLASLIGSDASSMTLVAEEGYRQYSAATRFIC